MTLPILYGLNISVYTRMVQITLREKAVEYVFREVDIFDGVGVPLDYLKLHPFGKIPAWVHQGFELYEAGAIMRYIDEAFSGPNLQPQSIHARARMNQTMSLLDSYAYRPMIWPVFVERVSGPRQGRICNEAEIEKVIPALRTCLKALAALLGNQPFFAGEQLTLADLCAAPILLYFNLTPEGLQMLSSHPNLNNWLKEMKSRKSILETRSIYEV